MHFTARGRRGRLFTAAGSAVAAMTKRNFNAGNKDPTSVLLAHILRENAHANAPNAPFMYFFDEKENIRHLSFADFRDRSYAFAAALNDLGYNNNQEDKEDQEEKKKLSIRLGDSPELLIALTGAVLSGTKVQSSKTEGEFLSAKSFGALVHSSFSGKAGEMVGAHEPIAVGPAGLKEKVVHWEVLMNAYGNGEEDASTTGMSSSSENEALFYFNSTEKGEGAETLFKYGERAAKAMELRREDVVMIGVPLLHAMGFGFGALGAMMAGARIMVPGTCDGVVDDSVKIDRAGNAKRALMSSISNSRSDSSGSVSEEAVTAMVSDMHIVKALREEDGNRALLKNVRTGLVKVGGGANVGEHAPVDMLGVPFVTVGKMK
ncbi:unnamed protein product [Bathycoccus prasinos]|tara:strand:+ start:1090 stop:2217 length:1128 start_codon:yes stop_codon:yes gene_type:complete